MTNTLLARLPSEQYDHFFSRLEKVTLESEQVVIHRGERMSFVLFPLSCVLAKLVGNTDTKGIEVGVVGKEGVLPLYLFLGFAHSPFTIIVQNGGAALRMTAKSFHAEVAKCQRLQELFLRYTGEFLGQISHSAACNRLHSVEQRYCRWLLMTHDRVGTDEFMLKQAFVGKALGVRRMSITPTAKKLEQAGFIKYSRGRITILNRNGIEGLACDCYRQTVACYTASSSLDQ